MQVKTAAAPAAKPGAPAVKAKRNCPTCMGPLGEDVSRCNRCGKQVSGGRKKVDPVSKGRQTCPICKQDRVLKAINFGILPKSGGLSLVELDITACTICVQKAESIDTNSQNLMKAAFIFLGLAGFSLFQWMCVEEGAGMYTLGIAGFTVLAGILAVTSKSFHQSSVNFLVTHHPKVIDLKARGGVTLLSAKDLKKMSA